MDKQIDSRALSLKVHHKGENPWDIEIVDADTGQLINNITRLTWELSADELPKLTLEFECYRGFEVNFAGRYIADKKSKWRKLVDRLYRRFIGGDPMYKKTREYTWDSGISGE